jgi:hypothetical protein
VGCRSDTVITRSHLSRLFEVQPERGATVWSAPHDNEMAATCSEVSPLPGGRPASLNHTNSENVLKRRISQMRGSR